MSFLRRGRIRIVRLDTEDARLDSLMESDSPSAAVQPVLQAIAAEPRPHELEGVDVPLERFRAVFPVAPPVTARRRQPGSLSTLLGAKLGAAVAVVSVGFGATALAAYGAALPDWAQNIAHTAIGAPAATHKANATGRPAGPRASGPAAFGLCTAWSTHQTNGAEPLDAVALRNLAAVAGGESKIAAYCATIPHPGTANSGHPTTSTVNASGEPTGVGTAKPTDKGTGKPTGVGTGKPTGVGTGKPTGVGTGKPTGKAPGKPTDKGTGKPTDKGTGKPTGVGTGKPTGVGTGKPTGVGTGKPTDKGTGKPTSTPSGKAKGKPTPTPTTTSMSQG